MEVSRIGHSTLALSNPGLIGAGKIVEEREKGENRNISTFYAKFKHFKLPRECRVLYRVGNGTGRGRVP